MKFRNYLLILTVLNLSVLKIILGHPNRNSISVECVDTKEDFDFHSWQSNPPFNYAQNSSNLPPKFRDKLEGLGIFYFDYKSKVNSDIFENQNQSAIIKQREFVEDKRPAYLYIKYCGYVEDTKSGEQVVHVMPVKTKTNNGDTNQANLTLTNEIGWKEEFFEIDMDQFVEGIEIEIGSDNFLAQDFLFIDKIIFVQGVKISRIQEITDFCHSDKRKLIVSTDSHLENKNQDSPLTSATTTQTSEITSELPLPMSTVFPGESETGFSVSVVPTTVPSKPRITTITTTSGGKSTKYLTTNSSTTDTVKKTSHSNTTGTTMLSTLGSTTSTSIPVTTMTTIATNEGTRTTGTGHNKNTTNSLPMSTESSATSTSSHASTMNVTKIETTQTLKSPMKTEVKSPTQTTTIIDFTTESENFTATSGMDIDETTDDPYEFSSTFNPEVENSTTTATPALLIQDWLETHTVTFYTVLPTLAFLVIFGSCYIALRERRTGFYAVSDYR